MASNEEQSNSRSGLFRTIASVASTIISEIHSEKNKLDQELKLKNAECDNCFDTVEKLIASKGDLIEIQRDIYAHWAVYVGDGNVIHLLDSPDGKAQVVCQKLKEIVEGNVCRVNNLVKAAQRRQLVPKSVDDILKSAYEKLNDVFEYHLINNNCEHFATHCRYGSRFSEQALATEDKPIIKYVGPLLARSSPNVAASVARLANNTTY
jgi:kelch-like protein 24/35